MLAPHDFFDLSQSAHAALFTGKTYVWEAISDIGAYIQQRLDSDLAPNVHEFDLPPTTTVGNPHIYIGEGTEIDPGVHLEGPTIIGSNCAIRHGAYVRANTLLGDGVVVGHATEIKNSVMLDGSHAPHFNYVGDSLLGARVNLGAGTKLSNLAMNADKDPITGARPTVVLEIDGQRVDLGLAKIGAILGDDVQTGCNSVTNPGTLVGPRTLIYPLVSLRKGYYPPDSLVKLRQAIETAAFIQPEDRRRS